MAGEQIVVMGGSYNPPTIAHLRLMQTALDALNAQKGIFVPVSYAYVKSKMRKRAGRPVCIPDQLRLDMLAAMCEGDPRLCVSTADMDSPRSVTYQLMRQLQEAHPDARLHFLIGADKLDLVRGWAAQTDFLNRFGLVVFARGGVDPNAQISEDEALRASRDAFTFAVEPEGIADISSTAVRERMLNGQTCEALMHPGAWVIFKHLSADDFPPEIERFQGGYAFLSNDYPAPLLLNGVTYSCATSALLAAQCANESDRAAIAACGVEKAKKHARQCPTRADWEHIRLTIAEDILRAKFSQHPELAEQLKATGQAVLMDGGHRKDLFWGWDLYTCQGENQLGEALMRIRAELQKEI